jgi:hypothetical protein
MPEMPSYKPSPDKKTETKDLPEKVEYKSYQQINLELRKWLHENGYFKLSLEKPRDNKAGLPPEEVSVEDAKDKKREADERKIEGILEKINKEGFNFENIKELSANLLLLSFAQLSAMYEFFCSVIMEFDPASVYKQKFQQLLLDIQAAMRLKTPK